MVKLFDKEFPDLPGIGDAEWQKVRTSVSVTRKQIEELKASFGIDILIEEMVENAIHNESYQSLCKLISKVIFTPRPQEIKWQKTTYWLEDLLEKKEDKNKFILTNLHVATHLISRTTFFTKPVDVSSTNGAIYNVGKLFDTPIYVDPYMLYNNNELAIVSGNILEFKEPRSVQVIDEGMMAPKVITTIEYRLYHPNSDVYKIINLD